MRNGKSITWATILPASIVINIYLRYKKDPIYILCLEMMMKIRIIKLQYISLQQSIIIILRTILVKLIRYYH